MAFSVFTTPIDSRSTGSLHRRLILGALLGGLASIALLLGVANVLLQRYVEKQGDSMLGEAAHRAALVLGDALAERARETEVLALTPQVVAAAREGGARAAALGLVGVPIPTLEERFAVEHSMLVAPDTRLLLRGLLPHLDARDLILTDANGFNAVISDRSSDFVQSDESWWQEAWRDGRSLSDAAYDSASRSSVVALSSAVVDGGKKVGVLKIKFDVTPLVASLASAGAGVHIEVLDPKGRVILSSDSSAMGQSLPGLAAGESNHATDAIFGPATERAVTWPANASGSIVVAHVSHAAIAAPFSAVRRTMFETAAALVMILLALLFIAHLFVSRRIITPVTELAEAAEAVAAGDFSVKVRFSAADDEIGRLGRAIAAMVHELRRLAQAIASSARETNAMSGEITAGSEEMAATAGEIASTASDLSAQATSMAETIGTLATSATALSGLSVTLEQGAREGVERNTALRTLADENRASLDASAQSLRTLGEDVHGSAKAIEALAEASTEIRSFVALVRKLARQSKLLALNAAMEAARAGEQGEGFAVVATEVRRLAAMSSDAAERTESVVNGVLSGIQESRESAGRAVAMADEVRNSTSKASASFSEIERAVAEAEAWTNSVAGASTSAGELVAEMTARLEILSGGTESFAAAMEQVAASSQQQSAATEEIAGAANTLVQAADRLTKLVGALKVEAEEADGAAPERADALFTQSGPVRTLATA
jgi:methyl-accepting chemotaxis protein